MSALVEVGPAAVRVLLVSGLEAFERDPLSHTTGALARTDDGTPCKPSDPRATCFCALGMLAHLGGTDMREPRISAAADLLLLGAYERCFISTSRANDQGGRAMALWLYRRGIEILDTKGLPSPDELLGGRP